MTVRQEGPPLSLIVSVWSAPLELWPTPHRFNDEEEHLALRDLSLTPAILSAQDGPFPTRTNTSDVAVVGMNGPSSYGASLTQASRARGRRGRWQCCTRPGGFVGKADPIGGGPRGGRRTQGVRRGTLRVPLNPSGSCSRPAQLMSTMTALTRHRFGRRTEVSRALSEPGTIASGCNSSSRTGQVSRSSP